MFYSHVISSRVLAKYLFWTRRWQSKREKKTRMKIRTAELTYTQYKTLRSALLQNPLYTYLRYCLHSKRTKVVWASLCSAYNAFFNPTIAKSLLHVFPHYTFRFRVISKFGCHISRDNAILSFVLGQRASSSYRLQWCALTETYTRQLLPFQTARIFCPANRKGRLKGGCGELLWRSQ